MFSAKTFRLLLVVGISLATPVLALAHGHGGGGHGGGGHGGGHGGGFGGGGHHGGGFGGFSGGHHGGGFGGFSGGHHSGGFGGISGGHYSGSHHSGGNLNGGFSARHSGSHSGFHNGNLGAGAAGATHHNGATFSHRHLSAGSGANVGVHHGGTAAGLGGTRHHSGSSFSTRHAVTAHRPISGGLGSTSGAGNLGVGGHNHHGGVGMSNGHAHGGIANGGLGSGAGHHHGGIGGVGNGVGHHHGNNSALNHYPRWNWNHGGHHRSVFFFSPFFGGFGFPFIGYSPYGYGYGYNYGYPYYGRSYRRIFPYYGYGGLGYYGYGFSPYSYGNYGYATGPAVAAQPAAQPATTASGQFAQQGELEFKDRNYKAAIKSWRHALVDDPQNGVLVLMLAQALFADGQFDEAAGAVQQGLSLLPDDQLGVVVSNYKELYRSVQDYTNQLRALEKAAKAEPDEPAKLFLLGYHYGYLGYPTHALKKLDELLKIAPEDQMAHRLRDLMAAKAPATEEKPTPDAPAAPGAEARAPTAAAQR